MKLKDIMSTDVKTITPNSSADAAWERLVKYGINHLVVLDRGTVIGVLSERDLGGTKGKSLRDGRRVEELMTAQVITAKPDTTFKQAANLLRGHGVGSLPIVENKKLKGIVTIADLLELIGRGVQTPRRPPKEQLRKTRIGSPAVRRR